MEEVSKDVLTARQRFGQDYMSRIDRATPRKIDWKIIGKEFQMRIHGKPKIPPEVENNVVLGGMLIYYDLDSLTINSPRKSLFQQQKGLNLTEILPGDWKLKAVAHTSLATRPPEVIEKLLKYELLDLGRNEIVIGPINDDINSPDEWTKILLWDVLVARFIEQNGYPVSDPAKDLMGEKIEEKRTKVLDAIKDKTKRDPKSIALEKFE